MTAVIEYDSICDNQKNVILNIKIENMTDKDFYLFKNVNVSINVFKVRNKRIYANWSKQWKANEIFKNPALLDSCFRNVKKDNVSFISDYFLINYPINFCTELLKLDKVLLLNRNKSLVLSENVNSLKKLKGKDRYLIVVKLLGNLLPTKECKGLLNTINGFEYLSVSSKCSLSFLGL